MRHHIETYIDPEGQVFLELRLQRRPQKQPEDAPGENRGYEDGESGAASDDVEAHEGEAFEEEIEQCGGCCEGVEGELHDGCEGGAVGEWMSE